MIRFESIVEKVRENHPGADEDLLRRAYLFSARQHRGQIRKSGEPYLVHPLEVANILAELKLDPVTVRLKNFPKPKEFPFNTASGLTYDSGNYQGTLKKAQELAGWNKLLKERDTARKAGKLCGIGLSRRVGQWAMREA